MMSYYYSPMHRLTSFHLAIRSTASKRWCKISGKFNEIFAGLLIGCDMFIKHRTSRGAWNVHKTYHKYISRVNIWKISGDELSNLPKKFRYHFKAKKIPSTYAHELNIILKSEYHFMHSKPQKQILEISCAQLAWKTSTADADAPFERKFSSENIDPILGVLHESVFRVR